MARLGQALFILSSCHAADSPLTRSTGLLLQRSNEDHRAGLIRLPRPSRRWDCWQFDPQLDHYVQAAVSGQIHQPPRAHRPSTAGIRAAGGHPGRPNPPAAAAGGLRPNPSAAARTPPSVRTPSPLSNHPLLLLPPPHTRAVCLSRRNKGSLIRLWEAPSSPAASPPPHRTR